MGKQFMQKIVFFNTGWMDFYKGIRNDKIVGGGKYIKQTEGWGHELFNFRPANGKLYGYVQPNKSGRNKLG